MGRKSWQRRKLRRPSEILEAARAEFSVKPFGAVTMAGIAELAGVTKGTLYLYFASKQALFDALQAVPNREISNENPGQEIEDASCIERKTVFSSMSVAEPQKAF